MVIVANYTGPKPPDHGRTVRGECWACGGKETLTEHHLKAVRHGGTNKADNIIILCRPCHDVVEQPKHLSRDQIERLDEYPSLQTLIMARLLGDLHEAITMPRVEENVAAEIIKLADDLIHADSKRTREDVVAKLKRARHLLSKMRECR